MGIGSPGESAPRLAVEVGSTPFGEAIRLVFGTL